MKTNTQNLGRLSRANPLSLTKKIGLLLVLLLSCQMGRAQLSDAPWMEGAWGVTFPVFGGERLDHEVGRGYELVAGAQELVDELPATDYVITNLSYFAHSHYFPMRANANVDVAKEIHPSLVPTAPNDKIIFEVMDIFKKANKKIILYISCNYLDRASDEVQTAWKAYYNKNFGGDEYAAYRDLVQGFVKEIRDYADGYWFDTIGALSSDGKLNNFVAMFRATDPTALMGSGGGKYLENEDGSYVKVDSDGVNDPDESNYRIVMNWPNRETDFTKGHPTPLGHGAPPNSFGYEELMIPDMVEKPIVQAYGRSVLKHTWFPIRDKWHVPGANLMFGIEDAYRFVRRLTDAGCAITFANTISSNNNKGHMKADEMVIMKAINDRLMMKPPMDYEPYYRPEGAHFVDETKPNYKQIIDFQEIPVQKVGDPDFKPWAIASSKLQVTLSSSNTNVATIVNGKIRIKGVGTTNITAAQNGNNTFAAATKVVRKLRVTASDNNNGENNNGNQTNGSDPQTIGPWNITELREVPGWRTSNVAAVSGMTGLLYESINYLGKKVEVFAYYDTPSGTPPAGGWPAVIFVAGGTGDALPQAVKYWVDNGYAAISIDTSGQYPNNNPTPNPGPKRAGVWNDYQLPIKNQWYYHAIAQVMKAHSLMASFPEVNAQKIGVMGASWGGTITSTVMGVDNRFAWALPIYGAGFLAGSDGHQGDAITSQAEANFVSTYFDGSAYFGNVDFPTFWLNGMRDHHFSLSCNQQSSRAVNGPTTLLYLDGFGHGNLNWTKREEPVVFANSVVNGGQALAQVDKPYIDGNKGYVKATAAAGMGSAKLFYTLDGEDVDLNEKNWQSKNASIAGNTVSASIPNNAKFIIFEITDARGRKVTSEYLDTSDTSGANNNNGGNTNTEEITPNGNNLALNGVATQSATMNDAEAARAIDGNTIGHFGNGSVSAARGPNAWWQVDLGDQHSIAAIHIYNRTNTCCIDRLSDFTVTVINSSGKTTFSKTITQVPDPAIVIDASGANGKIVRIESNNGKTLNLAEVQVFGATATCANFETLQAEDLDHMSGIVIESNTSDTGGGKHLGFIENNEWVLYKQVDLTCATSVKARISSKNAGGNIQLRLDSPSGKLIGTIGSQGTGSWDNWTTLSTQIEPVSGTHNLYLVFKGGDGYLLNLNWIAFSDHQAKATQQITHKNQIMLYPNPAKNQFYIHLESGGLAAYAVSDATGKIALKGILKDQNTAISANALAPGLYLIEVINGSNTYTGRLIIK